MLLGFRLQDMQEHDGGPQGGGWWDKVDSKFKNWSKEDWKIAGFRGMTEHIEKGFIALQQLPDYYKHLLYIACSASFGIKAGKGAMGLIKKK